MRTFFLIIALLFANFAFTQTDKTVDEAKGLNVGDLAPDFSALSSKSTTFNLNTALKDGPVVLIFYRGFWCPVCNQHLSQLQDSLQLIKNKGVQIIAVSPEKPEYLQKTEEKTNAEFTILYDENYRIAKSFDVNYKPTSVQLMTFNVALGAQIKKSHTTEDQNLPIPATFIINPNGEIAWRHFDPDYKNRASVKDILNALDSFQP